jgi:hypothetical protein
MKNLKTMLFCSALTISPGLAFGHSSSPAEQTAAEHAPAPRPAPIAPAMSPDQAASYASREQAAPELQKFKGGASLSITLGTGALLLIALIVALVIIF